MRVFGAVLLVVLAACGGAPPVPSTLPLVEPPTRPPLRVQWIPASERPSIDLGEVYWTTPREESLKRLGERWGVRVNELRRLNPSLAGRKTVREGERLLVTRLSDDGLSRSVGTPNRGRLIHAVAMPEGVAWQLRPWRPHTYGTRHNVAWLVTVLESFARRHPELPPLVIGDIARRRGGRTPPHRSHQSGRDVDLGYVAPGQSLPKYGRWAKVTPKTFDAALNWELIALLAATNKVEHIYVDRRYQKALLAHAATTLGEDELARMFALAAHGRRAQSMALVDSWPGHDDHMHIRFRCTPGDERCGVAVRRRRRSSRRRRRR